MSFPTKIQLDQRLLKTDGKIRCLMMSCAFILVIFLEMFGGSFETDMNWQKLNVFSPAKSMMLTLTLGDPWGVNLRPYTQSFPDLSTSSHWHHAARGSIVDGDTKDGILYGVGTDSWKVKGGKTWSTGAGYLFFGNRI